MERMDWHWAGWADSSSTPASPVHLSPPGSHQGTSHSSVSTCSAQFGRLRVSNPTSNWPPKSNICHTLYYWIWIWSLFVFRPQSNPAYLSSFISALNVRCQKLLLFLSWPFFFQLDLKTVFAFTTSQKAEIWQDMLALIFTASVFWAKWCPANSFWKSLKSSALQADESPNQFLRWCNHNFLSFVLFMWKRHEKSAQAFRNVSEEAVTVRHFDALWVI